VIDVTNNKGLNTMSEIGSPQNMSTDPHLMGGNIARTQYHTLEDFGLGKGTIGPENRADIEFEKLLRMQTRVASGEFNVPVDGIVPDVCVDGRTKDDGTRKMSPSAAGGTLSTVYARKLADNGLLEEDNCLELTSKTVELFTKSGYGTGVHGDDHGDCGCGACMRAPEIFQHIADNSEKIVAALSALGVKISPESQQSIASNAKKTLNSGKFFAVDRASVLKAAQISGADYEGLVGVHNELLIAINTREGTTIDRAMIREVFGEQYDLFVVDVWAFRNAAEKTNITGYEEQTDRVYDAMLMQNVATASILGHKSLSIVAII